MLRAFNISDPAAPVERLVPKTFWMNASMSELRLFDERYHHVRPMGTAARQWVNWSTIAVASGNAHGINEAPLNLPVIADNFTTTAKLFDPLVHAEYHAPHGAASY